MNNQNQNNLSMLDIVALRFFDLYTKNMSKGDLILLDTKLLGIKCYGRARNFLAGQKATEGKP